MDAQVLATVSNLFQIIGVSWVLFFGSRTIFEAINAKRVGSHTSSVSSSPPGRVRTSAQSSLIDRRSHDGTWEWVGVFILFFSSFAWVAFKANVLHADLLWYEVLIIGLVPSSVCVSVETYRTSHVSLSFNDGVNLSDEFHGSIKDNDILVPGAFPRIVGCVILGPLISISAYFLLIPFHLPDLVNALILFIIALVILSFSRSLLYNASAASAVDRIIDEHRRAQRG